MTDYELMQQALEVAEAAVDSITDAINQYITTYGTKWRPHRLQALYDDLAKANNTITALREALAQPKTVQCEPQHAVTEDGYCEWVCPDPQSYLMQCCDCGLIHEVQMRVAKYKPQPSEDFVVVDDPDLQAQWRMRRRDEISPKKPEPDWFWEPADTAYRPGGLAQPLVTGNDK